MFVCRLYNITTNIINMKDFDDLENNLKEVVKKYSNSFPNFDGTENTIISRLKYYAENKKPIVTDFNLYINKFISENELTFTEKEKLNAMISKYERKLIYGINYPFDTKNL